MNYRLIIGLLLLLTACSTESQTAQPTPAAGGRAVAPLAQPNVTIAGRLLYVQGGQLWLHSGSQAQALPVGEGVRDAAWSHDGQQIALIRRDESFADLYVFELATRQTTRVTFNDSRAQPRSRTFVHQVFWAAQPTWSPDDREIIYLSQVAPATTEDDPVCPLCESPLQPYRYELSLLGQREPINADRLPIESNSDLMTPRWSPDGAWLAYVDTPRRGEPRQLMRWSFATGSAEPFPGVPAGAYDPAWSPDGAWLAFAINDDGRTDIWVVPSAGGTPQRITQLGRARSPAWSPDGTQLACINVGDESTDIVIATLKASGGSFSGSTTQPLTRNGSVDASAGLAWSR